eukprot:TRINITY_DN15167_c1_g2_i2.p1 TRINITY_DN15167_c1_g2~~TRINITY_DN15167_c1_g2_i2.p1  ORF type:complete len:701 (+),score=176.25 TRINITY_DN15167_c1_g2_i2:87-2105(+)
MALDAPVPAANAAQLLPALRREAAAEIAACGQEEWADDSTLLRFIRGNIHNRPNDPGNAVVQATMKQLTETLRWRKERRPEQVTCPRCMSDPTSHSLRIVGFDSMGRAVGYTCFEQATFRTDGDANVAHMLWCMEESMRLMKKAGRGADSWVWIADFHGYSIWTDGSPSTARKSAELLAHYPEGLGKALMIDSGTLFESSWKIIKKILNERTSSKIQFISRADLRQELSGYCDAEMVDWVLREVEDNRQRKPPKGNQGPGKRYWLPPESPGEHDPRGPASWVNSPLYTTAPWLPQPARQAVQLPQPAEPPAPHAEPPPAPEQAPPPAAPAPPAAAPAPPQLPQQRAAPVTPPPVAPQSWTPMVPSPPPPAANPWAVAAAVATALVLCWLLGAVSATAVAVVSATAVAATYAIQGQQPPVVSVHVPAAASPRAPPEKPPVRQSAPAPAAAAPGSSNKKSAKLAALYDGVVGDALARAAPNGTPPQQPAANCVRRVNGVECSCFDDAVSRATKELLARAEKLDLELDNGGAVHISPPPIGRDGIAERNAAAWAYGALAALCKAGGSPTPPSNGHHTAVAGSTLRRRRPSAAGDAPPGGGGDPGDSRQLAPAGTTETCIIRSKPQAAQPALPLVRYGAPTADTTTVRVVSPARGLGTGGSAAGSPGWGKNTLMRA